MPCGLVLCTSGVVEILGILLVVPDIRVVDVFFSRFFLSMFCSLCLRCVRLCFY